MTLPLPQLDLPPTDILIVGLGPGALGDLSLRAWQALTNAGQVVVRTDRHPVVATLAGLLTVSSCDDLYEQNDHFDDVYDAIVARLIETTRHSGSVVYAVPGHPWLGEATTPRLLAAAAQHGLSVGVIDGMSFVEPVFAALQVDPMDGAQLADAMLLARQHHPTIEPTRPLLIGQLYARWLASDLKLTLMNCYPDDHGVTIIRGAGTPQQTMLDRPLHELDHGEQFDHMTSLYVPPLPYGAGLADLQELVAHLRAPEGCPWDQEQTMASLRQDLLGEAVEVLEAIDVEDDGSDNSGHIAEELGDLLLLATMLVQIATEEGRFKMADVVHHVVHKLIRRHPHVFGDTEIADMDDLFANWDAIKAEEKAAKGIAADDPLAGIPPHLPALEKARVLQSKAHKAGLLDRAGLSDPALATLLGDQADSSTMGELLWKLVALAQARGLNAEDALRSYTGHIHRRIESGRRTAQVVD